MTSQVDQGSHGLIRSRDRLDPSLLRAPAETSNRSSVFRMPKGPRARVDDLAKKMLLLLGTLILVFAVAEGVLRLARHHGAPRTTIDIDNAYAVADSVLDWRFLPNSQRKSG